MTKDKTIHRSAAGRALRHAAAAAARAARKVRGGG